MIDFLGVVLGVGEGRGGYVCCVCVEGVRVLSVCVFWRGGRN